MPEAHGDPAASRATATEARRQPRRRAVAEPPRAAGRRAGDWERKLAGGLAFLRRRLTGDYEVDEFGFDPDLTEHVLLPLLRPLYEKWFRVETRGLDNVPDDRRRADRRQPLRARSRSTR